MPEFNKKSKPKPKLNLTIIEIRTSQQKNLLYPFNGNESLETTYEQYNRYIDIYYIVS